MNDFRDYEYIEHYGVKGMHWGIRRDQKLLSEHRYNVRKDELKDKYLTGQMERKEYKAQRKAARKEMRAERKKKYQFSKDQKDKLAQKYKDLHSQTMKELGSHYRTKANIDTAHKILTGLNAVGSEAYGLLNAAALGSVAGPIGAAGFAVGYTAGNAIGSYIGYKVRNKVIRQFT